MKALFKNKFLYIGLALVAICAFAIAFFVYSNSALALIRKTMSEVTEQYYFGQNASFSVSISVGQREEPYAIDGVNNGLVDFSLVAFKCKTGAIKDSRIFCKVIVDGQSEDVALDYNPLADCYMCDLGYKLKSGIVFAYNNREIIVERINFNISHTDAIKIASQYFKQHNFALKGGECYLKVLGGMDGEANMLWCFSYVLPGGKSANVIISTVDGSIIAGDLVG